MVENIKRRLADAKFIACTSDLWSKDRRSFIAVNAHWIDENTGELESALLACDRFRGSHTGIAIENKIKFIFEKYKIHDKVVSMTTDNASNYKCAFERNGDDYQSYADMMATIDEDEDALFQLDLSDLANAWCPAEELLVNLNDDVVPLTAPGENEIDSDEEDDDAGDDDGAIKIANLPQLKNVLHPAIDIKLPSRIDCGAHTLNLVGKVDSFNALSDESYCMQYVAVFSKLNAIWKHSTTRSGKELFERYLANKTIVKPHRIRWNRIYNAVIFEII